MMGPALGTRKARLLPFVVAVLLRWQGIQSTASTPSLEILVSGSAHMTLYGCFFDEKVLGGDDWFHRAACCDAMDAATMQLLVLAGRGERVGASSFSSSMMMQPHQCLRELAMVPAPAAAVGSSPIRGMDGSILARYALVLPKPLPPFLSSEGTVQYLWRRSSDGEYRLSAAQTMSPYHRHSQSLRPSTPDPGGMNTVDISSQPPLMALEMESRLDSDGGLHRLFHHSFPITNGNNEDVFLVFLVVPQGMFIDLDDPLEAPRLRPAPPPSVCSSSTSSSPSHSGSITPPPAYAFSTIDDPDALVITATLHAAKVCDIEQPAFVSGQHVLAWELSVERADQSTTTSTSSCKTDVSTSAEAAATPFVVEFATKLHLRYPHPRPNQEDWIDLPKPILFAVATEDERSLVAPAAEVAIVDASPDASPDWHLEIAGRVWVATGKDEDHDLVMGVTIASCLLGVVIMLREISRVSSWDDV
jgi:PIG-X / PBN1